MSNAISDYAAVVLGVVKSVSIVVGGQYGSEGKVPTSWPDGWGPALPSEPEAPTLVTWWSKTKGI